MSTSTTEPDRSQSDESDDDEQPAIEADIVTEELRIDGICGVY